MEEALVKILKCLISSTYDDLYTAEEIIDDFLEKSELALSPNSREELINHLNPYVII